MEVSDDEANILLLDQIEKESSQPLAPNGRKFVEEVLSGHDNTNFCENFRMTKEHFSNLCVILQTKGLLRHTNRIKVEEKLAILLYTIGHNQRIRTVQKRFSYSGETISRHFNNVLNAIMSLSSDYFDTQDPECPQEIVEDTRFYPYFKNCVGVVDGMHIPVMVGVDEQGPFRNRHGVLSQNVMAACSFGSQFQYVLAGWEGSATDSCVLNAALTRHSKLRVPEGKFYLVDEDYRNTPGLIAPYPGVRYQLSEFSGADDLQNAQELFNFRHSLLRSTIESTFKIWKARFPILTAAPLYPLQTQVKLVIATCILHNYIRKEKGEDWLFNMCEDALWQHTEPTATLAEKESVAHVSDSYLSDFPCSEVELEMASELRDSIAAEMWNDHIRDSLNLRFDH
ncbi:uncharacterized protein LOC113281723 [Papaver somniferum]|uniref:uncharacterized protein LOC113281723 n=1 Tax=Papaver somniferum TaxID=3469 RepID=UPI000E6F6599|nr:uncharacterized protein LOC113281723 [Papaver somniferum]